MLDWCACALERACWCHCRVLLSEWYVFFVYVPLHGTSAGCRCTLPLQAARQRAVCAVELGFRCAVSQRRCGGTWVLMPLQGVGAICVLRYGCWCLMEIALTPYQKGNVFDCSKKKNGHPILSSANLCVCGLCVSRYHSECPTLPP